MRLIDANELMDNLVSLKYAKELSIVSEAYNHGVNDSMIEVGRALHVDAVPVIHAHWIEFRTNGGNVHYKCSRCGKEVSYPYAKKRWKYCIECGAKMDEMESE